MQLKALYSSWQNKNITKSVFNDSIYSIKSKITKTMIMKLYIISNISTLNKNINKVYINEALISLL